MAMKSQMVKRSVVLSGRKQSISLENVVWKSLEEIATHMDVNLLALLAKIDSTRVQNNLTSATRLFVLNFYREQLDIRDRHKAIEAVLRSPIPGLH